MLAGTVIPPKIVVTPLTASAHSSVMPIIVTVVVSPFVPIVVSIVDAVVLAMTLAMTLIVRLGDARKQSCRRNCRDLPRGCFANVHKLLPSSTIPTQCQLQKMLVERLTTPA